MIHILDIHSHKPGEGAIYNLTIEELRVPPPYFNQKQWLSVGLHPWSLTEEWRKDFLHVRKWALLSQVKAIGESGLDKIIKSPYQHEAFFAHVNLLLSVFSSCFANTYTSGLGEISFCLSISSRHPLYSYIAFATAADLDIPSQQ